MVSLVKIDAESLHLFQGDILEIERRSFPTPWSLNAFIEEANRKISYLWALLADDTLVGYMCFWMFADEIHLMNIAIQPEKRGKGLGGYLLDRMIYLAESKGIHRIWLEVRPSNVSAKNLYEKMGFKEIGRRPEYYPDTKEDAIIMSMALYRGVATIPQQFTHRSGLGRSPGRV